LTSIIINGAPEIGGQAILNLQIILRSSYSVSDRPADLPIKLKRNSLSNKARKVGFMIVRILKKLKMLLNTIFLLPYSLHPDYYECRRICCKIRKL